MHTDINNVQPCSTDFILNKEFSVGHKQALNQEQSSPKPSLQQECTPQCLTVQNWQFHTLSIYFNDTSCSWEVQWGVPAAVGVLTAAGTATD